MAQDNLDLKDRKMLYQLDLNARQSNSQIAKKVGLSKDVVNYRIKRLEEQDFIKNYYTIINFYKLGYLSVRVYIKLIGATPEREKEITQYLIESNKVFYLNKMDGQFDLGIGSWVKNIYEFEEFYLDFKNHFKKWLGKDQISIFTKVYHFHRAYLLDKKTDETRPELMGGASKEQYDKKDIAILQCLAKNSVIPATEISKRLGIPLMTVLFRIKQLEKKKIIEAYRFIFNYDKYGYEYYKVDLILDDLSRLKELVIYAHLHPNILYIDQTIGGSDFEFDIEVKDKNHFLEIIDDLKRRFPEIREWSYFTIREYKKLLYFPD